MYDGRAAAADNHDRMCTKLPLGFGSPAKHRDDWLVFPAGYFRNCGASMWVPLKVLLQVDPGLGSSLEPCKALSQEHKCICHDQTMFTMA